MKFVARFLGYFILWAVAGGLVTASTISFMGLFYFALPATSVPEFGNVSITPIIFWTALICGLIGGYVKAAGLKLPAKLTED